MRWPPRARSAPRFGLPSDDVAVLKNSSNVLVRMGSVVARVPGTTATFRPEVVEYFARGVALASFLHSPGAVVVPPAQDPPAGPHLVDGVVVTLWRFAHHEVGRISDPAVVGRALGARWTGSGCSGWARCIHLAPKSPRSAAPRTRPIHATLRGLCATSQMGTLDVV